MNRRILASAIILGLALGYVILVTYSIGIFYRLFLPWQLAAKQPQAMFQLSLHLVHTLAVLAAAIPPAAVIAWRYGQNFFIPALLAGCPVALMTLSDFINSPGAEASFIRTLINLKDLAVLLLAPSLMAWLTTRATRRR